MGTLFSWESLTFTERLFVFTQYGDSLTFQEGGPSGVVGGDIERRRCGLRVPLCLSHFRSHSDSGVVDPHVQKGVQGDTDRPVRRKVSRCRGTHV